MSILINGIDMPKYESLTIKIMPSGAVCDQYGRLDERVGAVEVPKHGRLIDANELKIQVRLMNWGAKHYPDKFMDVVLHAPTIIEAEGKE